jgi:HK97 family phage major capsid protein
MDLRQMIAEKFHTTPDKVTDAQVKAFEGVLEEYKAQALPAADEGAAQAQAIEQMQADLDTEKQANAEFRRQVAEWKDKPQVDPDEGRIAMDRLSRMKSIPEITTLVCEPAQDDKEKAAQRVWDDLHTLSTVFCNRTTGTRKGVKGLAYWQKLNTVAPAFAKALDTATAQEGADWAPTEYGSQMIDAIFDDVVVPALFPRFPMARSPLNLPFAMTGSTAYLAGEAISDSPAEYTPSTPRSDDITFTAKKLAVLVNMSDEIQEEVIIPLLPQLQATISRTIGEGIEDAILDGQATGAIDSDVTSSADRRMAWDGLRYYVTHTTTTAWKSFATLDGDNALNAVLTTMTQKYLPNGVWLFPMKKRYNVITMVDNSTNKNPLILRSTQLGDTSIVNGTTPDLMGNPVVFSQRMRTNLNASGVYDGTTIDKTWACFVNRNAWMLADRREVRLEVERKPAAGYSRMIGTWRGAFACVIPSGLSEVHTGGGYNF